MQAQSPGAQAFAAFAEPRFRWWFLSQVVSSSGSITQGTGLAWLVLQLGGSGVDLATVGTLGLLPLLLIGPWGGLLADRFDRRILLLLTTIISIVIGTVLTIITAAHLATIPLIFVLSVATGVTGVVDGPARQMFVLDLVGGPRLASAISLHEVVINASRVLGPSIGGVLLGISGAFACFAFNTASFLPPLLFLLLIRPANNQTAVSTARRGVFNGIIYALRHPIIRSCLLLAIPMTVIFDAGLLYPVLLTKELGFSAAEYGAAMAAFGLGALPGAIAAASRPAGPTGPLVAVLSISTAFALGPFGIVRGFFATAAVMAVLGFVSIWMIASTNTLIQLTTDPELRGRVMGLWTMVLPGAGVLTYLLAGWASDTLGIRTAFELVAVAMLAVTAVSWRPLMRVSHRAAPSPDSDG